MKPLHLLLVSSLACAGAARAERVLWTETATVRTKTIFADDGTLLYQQNWDKQSRQPIGTTVDRREQFEAWNEALSRGPAHYGTPPGPSYPMPHHGDPAGSPRAHGGAASTGRWSHQGHPDYGTPGSLAEAYQRQQGWVPGPFAAPPAHAPAAPARPQPAPVDPRAAVGPWAPQAPVPPGAPMQSTSGLREPGGPMNPHPQWTQLYQRSQSPLPERDAHGLPPPPIDEGPVAVDNHDLQGRPLHPEHPGQTDRRFYNRVGGKVLMRPDNMIRVKVMDRLTSGRNKRGDTFRFVLLEPVMYGLRTLVPAGSKGIGRISKAKSRGQFGRPGQLSLEFGSIDLPGATPARIYLAETVIAPQPKQAEAMALGAGGLVAFGPLGLIASAAIRGHDVVVEAGAVFHVEVAVDVPWMHSASAY